MLAQTYTQSNKPDWNKNLTVSINKEQCDSFVLMNIVAFRFRLFGKCKHICTAADSQTVALSLLRFSAGAPRLPDVTLRRSSLTFQTWPLTIILLTVTFLFSFTYWTSEDLMRCERSRGKWTLMNLQSFTETKEKKTNVNKEGTLKGPWNGKKKNFVLHISQSIALWIIHNAAAFSKYLSLSWTETECFFKEKVHPKINIYSLLSGS